MRIDRLITVIRRITGPTDYEDVGRIVGDVLWVPFRGKPTRLTVMVTKKDYDDFAEQLAAIDRPIVVGFEATGNYHRTLAHRLLTAGFELRLISSVALARTREALHNGWDKNDSKDA